MVLVECWYCDALFQPQWDEQTVCSCCGSKGLRIVCVPVIGPEVRDGDGDEIPAVAAV